MSVFLDIVKVLAANSTNWRAMVLKLIIRIMGLSPTRQKLIKSQINISNIELILTNLNRNTY